MHIDLRAAVVLLTMVSCVGCSQTIQPSEHIAIERELLLPDLKIQSHQVIQTADGKFIVAGEQGQVSAVALSENGQELWTYEEPYDPKIPGIYQGKFVGVVQLQDGDLLFCGETRTANPENPRRPGFHTLTRVLSAEGKLRTANTIDPEDPSLHAMGFTECVPSGDGALIFGSIYNPLSTAESLKPNLRWVVKVDRDGKKEPETIGQRDDLTPPFPPSEATPSGATAWSFSGPRGETLRLTRVSTSGEVTSTRDYPCGYFLLQFHTIEPSDDQSFLCAPNAPKEPNKMKVFRFNGARKAAPVEVELKDMLHSLFNAQLGTGYELKNGYFLVFGRIPTQSGDRAVIQLFDNVGHSLGFRGYDQRYPSFGVQSVYSLGNNRFLALRQPLSGPSGLVLSWVRVN